MPHQCVHCKRIIPMGSEELLTGCRDCGNHFFFYIREEKIPKMEEMQIEIPAEEKRQIEKDIREMAGISDEDIPVILDIESVRVTSPGKFEIDLANLFNKDRPLVYKIEEGKYIIDLTSTLGKSAKELKEIKNPDEKK
ncbi:MAG TPA: Zn-ribbon containing protein [Patescibacteria group bacterium]|nr:Zn-ribbon containing protein [Patescibacteria group bacterium]